MKKHWNKLVQRWRNVVLVLLLLLVEIFLPSLLFQPEPGVPLSALKSLPLAGHQRLLIFAPHCDDETLGAGGLILAAERAGMQVRVVIGTNGDGYMFATIRDFKKIYPRPQDYIRLGKMRQQESLAALGVLGVKPSQVDFLSYPDRGTPALWDTNWSPRNPYRSPYSDDTKSPYPLTYDPSAVYSGQDYLSDVSSILKSYNPDLVIYPDPDDVHPDHWGMNAFVRLALDLVGKANPAFHPDQYTYLVHRPDFPDVRGLKTQAALTPPIAMFDLYPTWYKLSLTPQEVMLKDQAVQQYRSQLTLLRTLMDSFIRSNELFSPVQDAQLPVLSKGQSYLPSSWLDAQEKILPPVELDPTGDFITRSAVPASDLVAVYAARNQSNELYFCVEARENTLPEFTYLLRLKAIKGTDITFFAAKTGRKTSGWQLADRSGKYACSSIPLQKLGDPSQIFLSASVVGGGRVIDEVGWQMVDIQE